LEVLYILVKADMSYNTLKGHKTLNQLGAIIFTPYMVMKFPSDIGDIITVRENLKEARKCYSLSLKVIPYLIKG